MYKVCLILMFGLVVIFFLVSIASADETSEIILKLLIKKGIISQKEVEQMKAEIAKEEPPVPATLEGRLTRLEEKQKQVPAWIKNFKLKGDVRLRNDYIDNDIGKDNNRQRLRFRLGGRTKINDQVKVGFGLATGSSDSPTSTNQTLEQEFNSKEIWLDYAYASYEPYDWLYFIGGKFKSPFFHTDMLWDSDIRFDGFVGKLTHELNPEGDMPTSLNLTAGYFPIDNRSSSARDLYLITPQIGTETKFKGGAKLKTSLAYYDFHSLEGYPARSLVEERGTNTYVGTWSSSNESSNTSTLRYDYRVISPIVELGLPDIFGIVDVSCGLLYEFAHNSGAPTANEAWRAGFWLGESKVKEKNQWKLLYQYTRLEKDAFFDAFPDSDFNNAGTDGKGWEVIFDYGLNDNVIFSIDYYNTESISITTEDQQILQTDLIFKF